MPVSRFLPLMLLLSACGGPSASPTSGAVSSSPTPTPAVTSAPATVAPATASPGAATGLSFAGCPPATVTSGEPPATDNGPKGACEAAEILFPAGGTPCSLMGGTYAASSCPLYPDLVQRLDQHPLSGAGGGADPVCRCQNTWTSATWQVAGPTPDGPTTWDVRVTVSFGPSSQESFDVIVQGVQSGSLISDIQCAGGGAASSIRVTPTTASCAG